MKPAIAIYFGHDVNAAVMDFNNNDYHIYEFEKIIRVKHYRAPGDRHRSYKREAQYCWALDYMFNDLRKKGIEPNFSDLITKFSHPLPRDFKPWSLEPVLDRIEYDKLIRYDDVQHHELHALSAFQHSNFNNAVALTYDGGGDDFYSMVTLIKNGRVQSTQGGYLNVGYMFWSVPKLFNTFMTTPDRRSNDTHTLKDDNAGKLMGLSSYGSYNDKTLEMFTYYFDFIYELERDIRAVLKHTQGIYDLWSMRQEVVRGRKSKWKPQDEINVAWETQEVGRLALKKYFEEHVLPHVHHYDYNVVLGGGCALNVIYNKWLKEQYPDINFYVPPQPADNGLSLGMIRKEYGKSVPFKRAGHYSSLELCDEEYVDGWLKEREAIKISREDLASILKEGKIIGYIEGTAEIGFRALGHRSILAYAPIEGIKDKVNAKVKHREWYRPFAPMARNKDVETYFKMNKTSNLETMAYAVDVRDIWKNELKEITHVDGTARLQSINKVDNEILYETLSNLPEPKVLLNTSFNIAGRPILNHFDDALWMLDNTELDLLVIQRSDGLWLVAPKEEWSDEEYAIEKPNKFPMGHGVEKYV